MRQAFREIWPDVQESLDMPPGKRSMSVRKAQVTETLWALARSGWLRSSADRDVIRAVQTWVAATSPDFDLDWPEDKALYEAAKRLPERESE